MSQLRHWTESGVDDFVYRIGFDFVRQIEEALQESNVSQAELAKRLGVTAGRVSQILNNPGNITLRKMVECARALKRKISVLAYDDGDSDNQCGPVSPEVFTACWSRFGKPRDFFSLQDPQLDMTEGVNQSHSETRPVFSLHSGLHVDHTAVNKERERRCLN